MVGMFVNTLPLKSHVKNDLSFKDFLNTVKSTCIQAFSHQIYPFDELVNNLNYTRDTSRNPLFDTTFIYQNNGMLPVSFDEINSKLYVPDVKISKFDFSLEVIPNKNGELDLNFEYCTKLFKKDTIERLSCHFINIVKRVISNCEEKISDIDILSEEEKNKILYEFNNTKMDFPENKTILELFKEQVVKNPNNIAVVLDDKKLTYKELDEKSNTVANQLIQNNVNCNDVVCVFLPRSIELVISIWATLKCGAVYMPLHVNYPDDRVNYMIENSNAKVVLTNNSLYNRLSVNSYLILDDYQNITNLGDLKAIKSLPDDVAYIIYTSGSTGKPKGVQITNKCLNNFVHSFNKYFGGITCDDNFLSTTNISFDVSIFELFLPLLNGATLVLYHNELINDIIDYCDYIVTNEITGLYIPPNILNEVYFILKDKKNLKIDKLLVGVEAIKKETLDKYFLLNSKMHIVNGYGPTETTICCTALPYTNDMILDTDIIPIGKALYNNNIYILDSNQKILPIGISGELYVTGTGVGAGYINNDKETDKNYLNNIFDSSSKKMYKTGDIGKWNKNGIIELSGRKDNQVKISGYRIELDEIDSVIMSYPNIGKSITVVKDIKNKKRIISYFTSSQKIVTEDIEVYLSKKLASYMLPYKLIQLDALPITSNGKIDKKALPLPIIENNSKYTLPQNDTQKKLHQIWCKLFMVDKIDIYDNFFHIGGDSLLSIKLASRIYEEFKVKININKIFNNPTIKSLADIIDNLQVGDFKSPILIQPQKEFYPVSSAQKRMYLASNMDKNSCLYNISGGILLDMEPDIAKLTSAIELIVSRHDSLRTYFEIINGKITQKIVNELKIKVEMYEVNTNNLDELLYIYSSVFNLNTPPLFKVLLFKLPNGKTFIMIDVHHIIFDGISLNNFIQELFSIYNKQSLPELSISYKDFAVWEDNKLINNGFENSKNFWINQFKDRIPSLNLPTVYPRPSKKSYKGETLVISISNELTKKINQFAITNNVTPYMLMLACYYILLYNYTDDEEIIIGTPVSGRIYKELEPLLGMFVNSIPLKNTILKELKFKDFLKNVKESCLTAFEYQDYPFDLLVSDLKIPRTANRNPLFDTMFVYQNDELIANSFDGINANYYRPISKTSKFDISLEVLQINSNLELSFEYATDLFDKIFISNFAKHYIKLLELVLKNSDVIIDDISFFEDKDKNKPFYKYNEIKLDSIKDNDNIKVFEKQVDSDKNLNLKVNKAFYYENSSNEDILPKSACIGPRNEIEVQIAEVFKKLLPVSNFSIDDNFFDLGGDSVTAINLQIELLKLNFGLTYSDVFETPTIRELANKISANKN